MSGKAVFVVSGGVPIANDQLAADRVAGFAEGVTTEWYSDAAATPYVGDADVIIIMPSASGSATGSDYRDSTIPVVHFKGSTVNIAMNMTNHNGANSGANGFTRATAHPINDHGPDANVQVSSSSITIRRYSAAQLGPGAVSVYTLQNQTTIGVFAYEAGALGFNSFQMPARRVFLGYEEDMLSQLFEAGWLVFDRAVKWAAQFPVGGTSQNVAVNPAAETDTARSVTPALTGPTVIAVGKAAETDVAWSVTGSTTPTTYVTIGQASEVHEAATIPHYKIAHIGQAAETDTARSVVGATVGLTVVELGRAVETDAARDVSGSTVGLTVVPIGQASETATARPFVAARIHPIGQAAESSVARPFAVSKVFTVGKASEASAARSFGHRKTAHLGRAVETDAARSIAAGTTGRSVVPLGRVTETSAARPVRGAKLRLFGAATEAGQARDVRISKRALIGQAASSEYARGISGAVAGTTVVPLGRATEADVARAITGAVEGRVYGAVSPAAETDTARSIRGRTTPQIGRATETDEARSVLAVLPAGLRNLTITATIGGPRLTAAVGAPLTATIGAT